MATKSHLRISDQDREQAAEDLREHYAAGRLDSGEFEERLQAVYAAKTHGELRALSADLPALPPKPPTTRELVRQNVTSNAVTRNVAAGGTVFLACTGIWALTGAAGSFWPKWVLVYLLVTTVLRIRRAARRDWRRRRGRFAYWYEYWDGRREHRR